MGPPRGAAGGHPAQEDPQPQLPCCEQPQHRQHWQQPHPEPALCWQVQGVLAWMRLVATSGTWQVPDSRQRLTKAGTVISALCRQNGNKQHITMPPKGS